MHSETTFSSILTEKNDLCGHCSKCTNNAFAAGTCSDPTGGLTGLSQIPSLHMRGKGKKGGGENTPQNKFLVTALYTQFYRTAELLTTANTHPHLHNDL